MKNARRGSVLMELVIVFPVYLVLWGGLFMIGDMLIKATRLASSDRTFAFDVQNSPANGWQNITTRLFHPDREVTDERAKADDLKKEKSSEFYADARVAGPFSLRAAATVRNDYALPGGGTRGQLAFADWFFNRSAGTARATGDFATLLARGRVEMRSKDNSREREHTYNYYTLKRTKYSSGQHTWRSNARPLRDIVNATVPYPHRYHDTCPHWCKDVYREEWHSGVNDDSNDKNDPTRRGNNVEYSRYRTFVSWSE